MHRVPSMLLWRVDGGHCHLRRQLLDLQRRLLHVILLCVKLMQKLHLLLRCCLLLELDMMQRNADVANGSSPKNPNRRRVRHERSLR